MNDPWKSLIAADPDQNAAFAPADGLMAKIRARSVDPTPARKRMLKWLVRGGLSLVAVLLMGGAVSWATTGESPFNRSLDRLQRIWGFDRDAGLSTGRGGYGRDEFSVLEPMTEERLARLPEGLKFWLASSQTRSIGTAAKPRTIQKPRHITAMGETDTKGARGIEAEHVTILAMNGEVCLVYDRYHGGDCGTISEIRRTGLASTISNDNGPWWTIGVVTDEVATLRVNRPGYGEIPIRGNVFQANHVPEEAFQLVGRDENGSVVTRISVTDRSHIPALPPAGPPGRTVVG